MSLRAGVIAGAAGTTALNVATYLDMVLRARPASELPAKAAGEVTGRAGIELGAGKAGESRREGIGALLGYATGLGVGALYGLVVRDRPHPVPVAALALTGAAMAGSDLPMTVLGLTDPRTWPASAWAADVLPHLAYGLTTAMVYRTLTQPCANARRRRT
jgi:xanthosine utilization system XapX-like protein